MILGFQLATRDTESSWIPPKALTFSTLFFLSFKLHASKKKTLPFGDVESLLYNNTDMLKCMYIKHTYIIYNHICSKLYSILFTSFFGSIWYKCFWNKSTTKSSKNRWKESVCQATWRVNKMEIFEPDTLGLSKWVQGPAETKRYNPENKICWKLLLGLDVRKKKGLKPPI